MATQAEIARRKLEEAKKKAEEAKKRTSEATSSVDEGNHADNGEKVTEQPKTKVDESMILGRLEEIENDITRNVKTRLPEDLKEFIAAMDFNDEKFKPGGMTTFRIFNSVLETYKTMTTAASTLTGKNISHIKLINKVLINYIMQNEDLYRDLVNRYNKKIQKSDGIFF